MTPRKGLVAVVTMVYNEGFMLPIWDLHYRNQVGAENCFVLDHGSDDGCTDGISANVLRLPRSPFNETKRGKSCSSFCSSLLFFYERVIYCDVDEILIADPEVAPNLRAYAALELPPLVAALGMDVLQDDHEAPLDPAFPIIRQRSVARPSSDLSKPLLTSEPIEWGPGFHWCDKSAYFGDLYMFHLAYADFNQIARRQAKRNSVEFHGEGGGHHRILPDVMVNHIRNDYLLPHRVDVDLSQNDPVTVEFLSKVQPPNGIGRKFFQSNVLWNIPQRYKI